MRILGGSQSPGGTNRNQIHRAMKEHITELTGIIARANAEIKGGFILHPKDKARAVRQASKDMFLVMAVSIRKHQLN